MVAKDNYSKQISEKLNQVLLKYMYCLEVYCRLTKREHKNPVTILVLTKRLIAINQQIQAIAREIYNMKNNIDI